ncbi:MAG: Cna B-type domain-containing protein, partial [Erysipelotrichaceae bacterium]|nr:Cna B-type domain-containing protein [Erysipelotrichaceae bacterium]
MKPKTIKKLLSVVLSLVMILGLATNASSAKAESISFNNYLSSVTIDGSDASEIEELKADSTHTLELKTDAITISDLTGAGDYEISLPDGIAVENIASTDIYASIDGNSTKVGSYTVSSNKINITLDNLISEDENGEVTTDVNTTSSYSFTLDVTMNATFDGTTTSFKFSDSITKTVSYYVEETTTDNETEEDNTTSNNLLGSSKTSDADAVQALIDALPDVSELASMTTNELNEVNTALDAANDAYYELSDEDQALVDDSKLAELYNYFSGAISTVDDSGSNSITTVDATSYFNSATSTATVNSTSTFIDQTASSSTITTSSGDATTIIENGESYQIIFNLEFVDGTVSTNTVYTIDLSEISKYLNIDTSDIPTSASEAGTITYGEIVIGYWYLGSDNKIYFVFNDNVDGKDDGWVEIKLNATGSSDGSESDSKDIKVDLGTDTWEGTYVKSESSLNVEKTVDSTTVTEDNGNEAGTYTYSVKITSTGTNDLTSLQDYFKESWRSDSYKLLSYTGDGSDITVTVYNSDNTESATLTSGTDYTLSYTNDDSGNGYGNGYIQINFTDGYTLTDGQYIIVTYTLTYDPTNVTVTMDEITNYNKATVSYENNKDEDKSTDDDYTSKTSINHGTVEKDGKKSDDSNSVTWTVTAKKGNSSTDYLNNYVLQDDGTTGMDIDYTKEYSVTIYFTNGDSYPLTDSDAQNFISAMVSTSGVKISDYLTGTTYADLDVEKVIVVYTTTDDGTTYQNQTYTASNTVEIDKDGTKVDEDTEGIDDVGNHVDQGTIDKELVSVNQLTNTVSWKTTITVYPTGTLLYCFDELGTWNSGGHALSTDASDYKVTYTYYDDTEGKKVSKVLTLGNDYTISFDGTTKYTIDFTPDIVNSTSKNITIVIEYTTTYTDYLSEGTQISNKGTAYFENETEYDEDNTVIYMMIDKSVSSTDEESGTITWNITVDIFEILDKYYIYDKDTDTYTLSLPTTITIQDTLPKGTELTSNIVTLSGNGFWEFGNWSSSDKQITVTSTSGTITIDLTSTLTKLFTSNYLSAYLADSKTGNTYARFLTLTYSTVVTDYAAYLAGGEQEFTNSAQLYGDDLLGQDEETTKMTGESYLGKSGTDQKNGYYLFTVDGIAELVTAYANSSSYDKDSTNWTTVTLTDVYGADLQYNSSFSPTYTVNGTSSTIYLEGNEPDSSGTYVTYSIDESTHTITFNIPYSIATQLESISYYLKVLATTSDDLSQLSLTNTIYLEGQSDTAADTTVDGISSGSGVTGGYTSVLFHITKTDSDTGDALGGAEFTIYEADYDETSGFSYDKDSVVDSGTTLSSDGKLTLSNLTVNKLYAVVETGSPSGYVDISTVYYVIFVKNEDTVNSNYGDSLLQIVSDTFIIKTISSSESGTTVSITQDVTNTQVDSGELTITKSITDNNEIDLTDTDTLELLKGSTITITNTDDGTEYSIDLYELYVTNGGSKTYTLPLGTYTVSETGTVCGYTYTTSYTATVSGDATKTSDQTVTLISDDDSATVEITNTFTKTTKTSIDVTKVWNDKGLSHSNDSITVYLIVNGTPDSNNTLVLSESNNWSGTFDDLDVYDNNGSPITYSVGESTSSIKEGYSISLSGNMTDGYVITNTLQTSLTVTKSWNDSAVSSSRPSSITVQLYQNGETYGNSVTLSGDDWEYTYTKLPMYNEKGIAYTYTIEEVGETSGLITYGDNTYTVEYDQSNYIITNTITGTTEVTG